MPPESKPRPLTADTLRTWGPLLATVVVTAYGWGSEHQANADRFERLDARIATIDERGTKLAGPTLARIDAVERDVAETRKDVAAVRRGGEDVVVRLDRIEELLVDLFCVGPRNDTERCRRATRRVRAREHVADARE